LPNDGLQGADPKLGMIRHGHRDGRTRQFLLHGDVTAALANVSESVPSED
jgi:hypothetical protein